MEDTGQELQLCVRCLVAVGPWLSAFIPFLFSRSRGEGVAQGLGEGPGRENDQSLLRKDSYHLIGTGPVPS